MKTLNTNSQRFQVAANTASTANTTNTTTHCNDNKTILRRGRFYTTPNYKLFNIHDPIVQFSRRVNPVALEQNILNPNMELMPHYRRDPIATKCSWAGFSGAKSTTCILQTSTLASTNQPKHASDSISQRCLNYLVNTTMERGS